ncbi:MAG: glycosyltransferase family 2 protein [Hyphomonadaceae bacterium]|nr:glycosyltransferase family 2 protein [Hyphomonadaceae bacterium]MBX3509792.1 glycosyltransferase family 2 protein [Hyphomonadaceae bacterium]
MTDPLPISCYIRTLNEARMIGRVIEAARQIAAEVVVVDSGSTDATVEIATKAGARVTPQPWLGNGKQKRVAEELCTHDWLLDLDADEIVTPAFAAEVRALFANGAPPCQIYETKLVTAPPIGEPWMKFGVLDRRKLYDRRVVRQPDHAAWDQFDVPAGVAVGKLREPLLHYSFPNLEHLAAKLNHWSGISARESKLKPFWWVVLRVLFARPVYFLKQFVARGLWRAGIYGYAVAQLSAYGRWLRDIKMLEIHLKRRQDAHGRS